MIRSVYIDNFKSLVDFNLPVTPHKLGRFVCLVGLNGAGKSTVLQALDFLAHLPNGDIQGWLERRAWTASELSSKFVKRQTIHFKVEFEVAIIGTITWEGQFNLKTLNCTSESIKVEPPPNHLPQTQTEVLSISGRSLNPKLTALTSLILFNTDTPITRTYELSGLRYTGSTLSLLKTNGDWDLAIEAVRAALAGLRSLDMLAPQAMRQRSKEAHHVGYGGEGLSAYLHDLRKEHRDYVLHELHEFYPQLGDVTTRALRAGWKELSLHEQYRDAAGRPLETGARHVSDGMLRILTMLSQLNQSDVPVELEQAGLRADALPIPSVLFDEIENGINPELMERLVQRLLQARAQVFVTTHNPLVLNYLPDEVARESVIFLYRTPTGLTRAVRLFDLPSVARKLDLLGPGEAYVDTDLVALQQEANAFQDSPR